MLSGKKLWTIGQFLRRLQNCPEALSKRTLAGPGSPLASNDADCVIYQWPGPDLKSSHHKLHPTMSQATSASSRPKDPQSVLRVTLLLTTMFCGKCRRNCNLHRHDACRRFASGRVRCPWPRPQPGGGQLRPRPECSCVFIERKDGKRSGGPAGSTSVLKLVKAHEEIVCLGQSSNPSVFVFGSPPPPPWCPPAG